MKSKKQWKPEAIKVFGSLDFQGIWPTISATKDLVHDTPVRVIRERDYQRLLATIRKLSK